MKKKLRKSKDLVLWPLAFALSSYWVLAIAAHIAKEAG